MTPAVKLELARAAFEFADASLDKEHGDGWTVGPSGGGGRLGFGELSIPYALTHGKSVEEIKALLDEGMKKRAKFEAAWNRLSDRLAAATKRYLAARRAAGLPEIRTS